MNLFSFTVDKIKILMRRIDHIVYCVLDLDTAIDHIEKLFGIRPEIGGRHLAYGTKNALLNLGQGTYLEILARDSTYKDSGVNRWMGIDLIDTDMITRWAIKSECLDRDAALLKKYSPQLSKIVEGKRIVQGGQTLSWYMTLPSSVPEVEIIPFLTDWSKSPLHPTDRLKDGCELMHIELLHPKPEDILSLIEELDIEIEIVKYDRARIKIHVSTPNGMVVL